MGTLSIQANRIATLLKTGNTSTAWKAAKNRLYSESITYGLRRDLTMPFTPPEASIPVTIRPLQESDIHQLLDVSAPGMEGEEINICLTQLQTLTANIPTCYVAVTSEGCPCYMQWLIGPGQNARIQAHFNGSFPVLGPDEALLEGAFTPKAYRGLRIMPCAMAHITERAKDLHVRWVMTFVGSDNIPSLKGCKRAGYTPFLLRKARWRLFRRQVTFEPLPAGTPYPFDVKQSMNTP